MNKDDKQKLKTLIMSVGIELEHIYNEMEKEDKPVMIPLLTVMQALVESEFFNEDIPHKAIMKDPSKTLVLKKPRKKKIKPVHFWKIFK